MVKITLGVEGMACGMCEAHVNEGIRNKFSVSKVSSSAKDKQTVIEANEAIAEAELKSLIEEVGYTMTSYTCETVEKKGLFTKLFK